MGGAAAMKVKKLGLKKGEKRLKPGVRKSIKIDGMSKALRLKPLTASEAKKNEKHQAKLKALKEKKKQAKATLNERTVCIRNLDFKLSEETLKKEFGDAGTIESFEYPKGADGKPKGIAIVKYATQDGCDKVLKKHGTTYHGRELSVLAKGAQGPKVGSTAADHNGANKVVIKSLPFNASASSITAHFENCGPITNINVLLNSGGACRGIAYITFGNAESAKKARAELDGKKFEGKSLVVRDFGLEKATRARTAAGAAVKKKGGVGKTKKTNVKVKKGKA